MRTFAAALLLGLSVPALAQPSGWAASTGASAPSAEAAGPRIEVFRSSPAERRLPDVRPSRDCEIKPVMNDEDYRRCGARAPSYDVDFAAPWPADTPWPPEKGDVSRRRAGS